MADVIAGTLFAACGAAGSDRRSAHGRAAIRDRQPAAFE
ncbi:hypothetical protein LA76x_0542 [Lysobacter antibioticus]|uniref:Uncharacterized protein n=1 Tax=Lysobacter antibioticus TaxID=84531 RepID=A0A0S2F594_LYSAN|nr:hypothetical protein LA76x_0542 [Lysobacter antibioticus]